MLNVTLKDGSVRQVEQGSTVLELAASISQGLARVAVAGKVDGEVKDLSFPIEDDANVEVLTLDSEEGLEVMRHSASHLLAQAVKNLFPGTILGIGPAIANGFYYDFDSEYTFTPEDLGKIEEEMRKLAKNDYKFERREVAREEAIDYFQNKGEKYKVQLINDLPEDARISMYTQGNFTDLCAGPHVPGTKVLKAFKLQSLAGAYWRGSEKNKMLQRIYGLAFAKTSDLDDYLFKLEEAKRRDHRKLGMELDLFSLHDEGPGFPFFHPKGMVLRNTLEDFWRREHQKRGYVEIRTPIILNTALWQQSGHWDHYKENMYFTKIDNEDYAVKPMNCPGGMIMYKTKLRSYRDLPIRCGELGLVHRHELSGALHGLLRVRNFTQDDAHIFMLPSQIKDEIIGVINLVDYFYKIFGFAYHVELSTRPEDSMGSDQDWEMATNALKEALEAKGMDYKINPGDGAFYGPKIDFHLKDCLDRTWQCGTIQLDFQMPERFDLTYIGEDGDKHRPVMIHRVVYGSIERFIALLTEQYAGAFPVWLSPEQVRILPISDKHSAYAEKVKGLLMDRDIRAALDERREKINYKIREVQTDKIPFALVVGDKEAEEGTVSVRRYGEQKTSVMELEDLISLILDEISTKKIPAGNQA
ncbi:MULTISPECIES: threonine--tRNA ligase [Dehalobacter]|jgi:threonyl-tRNA synthetase|uniref:Threonine--tRNA ligase n=2 Tax=Dehalobacter restrictus TaxID=55583 RepID=A0A857DG65_9FIRM|nr:MULTISPECIES: threonine--tRNA ligase [Dehalobacter]AHF08971.1 threonyl-tRNA synthetase [Dehalobacter restrictus DSM 9455]MCG1025515.1 threonine--tRNA ligase [Dehalobacter sp.]MDJ0306118.1 threonine--tRNA ligase [Dehalobacter sp.]OCZ51924.1 threonine--tRNA ligase [Dehalobacter sp. TeCB1]QGZ99491.1 threonine--tRNA ligase [Dehalobacter restrictus]